MFIEPYKEYCKNHGCSIFKYIKCRIKKQCELTQNELDCLTLILVKTIILIQDDCIPNIEDWKQMNAEEQLSLIESYIESK